MTGDSTRAAENVSRADRDGRAVSGLWGQVENGDRGPGAFDGTVSMA
jgi:hypothetical protein